MYVSRLYNEIPPMEPSPRPHTDTFLDASPIFSPDQDGVTFFAMRTPKLGEGQWDRSWDHTVTVRDRNMVICLQRHFTWFKGYQLKCFLGQVGRVTENTPPWVSAVLAGQVATQKYF